MSTNFSNL